VADARLTSPSRPPNRYCSNPVASQRDRFNYRNVRLDRGDTTVHTYTSFDGGGMGYYVIDEVRYELTSIRGEVLSTKAVATTNTCANR
jgi:hypothetical protein